jgi:hypothetical protein
MNALTPLLAALLVLACPLPSQAGPLPEHSDFDSGTRFIFYSVLEGCYEDGLTNADADQILLRPDPHKGYVHFIYSCPVCMPTIWAVQAYRARPATFFSLKSAASSFGSGLPANLEKQLFSADAHQQLIAVNLLVKNWIARRMDQMHLSAKQRADLLADLEKKRKKGMEALKSFRSGDHAQGSMSAYAPGYVDLDECAVCNGAVGKLMKLPDSK